MLTHGRKLIVIMAAILLIGGLLSPAAIHAQGASDDADSGTLNDDTGGDQEDAQEEQGADEKQDEESLPADDPTLAAPADAESGDGGNN